MDKSAMIDKALEMIAGDLDDVEGKSAMAHSMDECQDPLTCGEHDGALGGDLTPDGGVKIEIKGMGLPSLDGGKEEAEEGKAEEGLSPEEAEELKKLLK